MKKLFLLIAVAVMTLSASAQLYIGGEAGFWRNWQDGANSTSFKLLPEIGYSLSENTAIGTVIGYNYVYNNGAKTNAFEVAPYFRYTYLKLDNVNLFLDGGFGFYTYKTKVGDVSGDAQNAWEVGVKPGVAVNLTDKLSFVAHVGFLGYRECDKTTPFGSNGFGLDVDGNALSFGLYWNF